MINVQIKKLRKNFKTNDLNKFLMYLDANNLYGHSMSQSHYHTKISNGQMI